MIIRGGIKKQKEYKMYDACLLCSQMGEVVFLKNSFSVDKLSFFVRIFFLLDSVVTR